MQVQVTCVSDSLTAPRDGNSRKPTAKPNACANILSAVLVCVHADYACLPIANKILITRRKQCKEAMGEDHARCALARSFGDLSYVIPSFGGKVETSFFLILTSDILRALITAWVIYDAKAVRPFDHSIVERKVQIFHTGGWETDSQHAGDSTAIWKDLERDAVILEMAMCALMFIFEPGGCAKGLSRNAQTRTQHHPPDVVGIAMGDEVRARELAFV